MPLRHLSKPGSRLFSRNPVDIPFSHIKSFQLLGFQYARALRRAASETETLKLFADFGERFSKKVALLLDSRDTAIYCMSSEAAEAFGRAKDLGMKCLLEQTIAPAIVIQNLLAHYAKPYPALRLILGDYQVAGLVEREYREWELADRIFCPSEFVRDSIAGVGGPVGKCVVVPYGIPIKATFRQSADLVEKAEKSLAARPFRVLTVGTVSFRKGAHLTCLAAQQLLGSAIFELVGGYSEAFKHSALADCPENFVLRGQVPRDGLHKYFKNADVFLLPSLCEGSAIVVYEALAYGIPVICTQNTGSVVEHGLEGLIIETNSPKAIVEAIQQLIDDRSLLETLRQGAKQKIDYISLESYDRRLIDSVQDAIASNEIWHSD